MKSGKFITVEGTDGSGKTTQIMLMKEYLQQNGYEVVLIREPGGTNISEKVRSILLDANNTEMGQITEMLLYASARAQLMYEVIKPSIQEGKMVICDRFVDSSFVYQGFGRGIDLALVEKVNNIAIDGVMPDVTFFFDIRPDVALARKIASTQADRIENEKLDFHIRVYDGYKKLAEIYPERIKSIDSSRSILDISNDVKGWLDRIL